MTINLKFKSSRVRKYFTKRQIVDPISWLVFFVLSIIFSTLYFLHEYDQTGMSRPEIVSIVLKSSICYTIFMIFPVYINLNILKKYVLDRKAMRIWTYTPYVLGVLLNALLFAWIFKKVGSQFPNFLQGELPRWLNALIIFGVQLIATGLMFKREFIAQQKILLRKIRFTERLKYMLSLLEKKEKEGLDNSGISTNQRVLKLGNKSETKCRLFQAKNVLFVEAYGNGSFIYYKEDDGIHRVESSNSLTKHRESGMLHEELFAQVHKSFIVAKNQVVGRNGSKILLNAMYKTIDVSSKIGSINIVKELEIPIGSTFEDRIFIDEWFGFQNKTEDNDAKKLDRSNVLNTNE